MNSTKQANLNPMALLQASGLKKSYKGRQVVQNVSLQVATGQVVGLLGPNGAGKTTSFYMIVGLVPQDGGTVIIDQLDITAMPMHQRARHGIGYLPQEASIFRRLTVEENLLGVLQLRSELSKAEQHKKVEALLEEFHIGHIRKNTGMSLSGGERRRVEIARALAVEPRFILLDEPFAGVDPISVIDIKRIIEHLRDRGLGVLITDHNVRETLDVCEKAYIVSHGNLIAEGTPAEVLQNEHVKQVYLGEGFTL
jgi:lipopolysaccharide export system ATP-binding protein